MDLQLQYHMVFGGTRNGASKKEYPMHPVYKTVRDVCLDRLTEPNGVGFFHKENILDRAEIHPADRISFRWDFLVRHLEEKHGAELIPLAENFFKRHKIIQVDKDGNKVMKLADKLEKQLKEAQAQAEKDDDWSACMVIAGRALAAGHGKKTAGYAAFCSSQGVLVLKRMQRTAAVGAGFEKSYNRKVEKVDKEGIELPNQTKLNKVGEQRVPRIAGK